MTEWYGFPLGNSVFRRVPDLKDQIRKFIITSVGTKTIKHNAEVRLSIDGSTCANHFGYYAFPTKKDAEEFLHKRQLVAGIKHNSDFSKLSCKEVLDLHKKGIHQMTNKYLIITILIIGILFSNNYIVASVVPALILNVCLWIIVAYAKNNYHGVVFKELLRRDIIEFNDRWYIALLVVVSRLSLAASIAYISYLLFTKFYGVIQLWNLQFSHIHTAQAYNLLCQF